MINLPRNITFLIIWLTTVFNVRFNSMLVFGFQTSTTTTVNRKRKLSSINNLQKFPCFVLKASEENASEENASEENARGEDGRNPSSFDGSDMTITEYPHPVLRRMGDDILEFRTREFRQLCKEMMTIMYQASGVGLAAPQVGLSTRLFVYNHLGDPESSNFERIVCNPKILEYSEEVDVENEGCLSSRSGCCGGPVCRSVSIMVEYKTEEGSLVRRRLTGFEARVFQHEYDHIEGILHFDRFCTEDRESIQPQLNALIQGYKKNDAVLEPDVNRKAKLQPMPLPRRGWIPPIIESVVESVVKSKLKGKNKKDKKKTSGGRGFGGGGGFGGGFGKSK